jgi:hypothetical protein
MWRAFCETLGEQGKKAWLFILALLAVFVATPFVVLLEQVMRPVISDFRHGDGRHLWEYPNANLVIGGTLLISLIGIWIAIRRWRIRRHRRASEPPVDHSPLAFVEWKTARSKLLKNRK